MAKASEHSKEVALVRLNDTSATKVILPLIEDQSCSARHPTGHDFWSYGFANNEHVIDCFPAQHRVEGLSSWRLQLAELFYPASLKSLKIRSPQRALMPVAHLPPARRTGNTRKRDSPSQNREIKMMTRQIIACAGSAFLALVGTAVHAQNSVTLYGIVGTGVEYVNRVVQGVSKGSVIREQSGDLTGSRWGLKGSKDLNGGYKAITTLEGGFSSGIDTLGQSGWLFGRKTFAGFATPSGMLTLGRHQNLLYELMFKYDPLTFNPSYSVQSMGNQFVNRAGNSVCHDLNLGGVTLAVLYSAGFDMAIQNGGEVPGVLKVGREVSAAILYDQGPLSVGVTYDQLQDMSVATQSNTQQHTLLGLSYQIGPVKALAGLRWSNTRNADTPPSSWLYWGGTIWQVNVPLSISASVCHTHLRESNGRPTMRALLVDYALSERTDVYAEGAYVANRSTTNVGIRGTGVDVVASVSQAGVTVGIRHLF